MILKYKVEQITIHYPAPWEKHQTQYGEELIPEERDLIKETEDSGRIKICILKIIHATYLKTFEQKPKEELHITDLVLRY